MRRIIITVTEFNGGEEANINVDHFHDGKDSEVESITVDLLNEFLFTRVNELSKGRNRFKPNNHNILHNEILN